MPAIPDYLTTAEAAKVLDLSEQHVTVLARSGQLAGAVKVGGYLIPASAVEERKQNPPKPGRKPHER